MWRERKVAIKIQDGLNEASSKKWVRELQFGEFRFDWNLVMDGYSKVCNGRVSCRWCLILGKKK